MVPMTDVTTDRDSSTADEPPVTAPRGYVGALVALASGGFAIGTTEFVTMGVLPQVADGRRRLDPEPPATSSRRTPSASSSARRSWRSSAPAGRAAGC